MSGQGQSLVLQNVTCVRGGRTLLSDFSLSLGTGDALQLTGPNGIGKSSLLRLMAGLLPLASGQIRVTGSRALADESLALDGRKSLREALSFWAMIDRGGHDTVNIALRAVALDHLAAVPVRILSTGQRKRAVLARVIASGAHIWLLDEPANGLDAVSRSLLESAIAEHRAGGGIVVAASHLPLAMAGAHTIALGG
jgi:heme exporter protein A